MTIPPWAAIPARALMALLFLISAYGKLTGVAGTQAYMHAYGVPGLLLWPAAAWEIVAGIALVAGFWPRLVCLGVAGWCLLTAAIFHTAFGDPLQFAHFFKNMTMAGAFLLFACFGLPGPALITSADRRTARLSRAA